jgi:hypothetical protein
MRTALASFVFVAVVLGSSVALADGVPSAPSAATVSPTRWYGYETLATDGAALVLAVPAFSSSTSGFQTTFGVGSLVVYGLGGPIVHFAHGHVGKGFADLGLRVAMPLVLGFFGGLIGGAAYTPPPCNPGTQFCGLDDLGGVAAAAEGATIGGLLGIGSAIAIDAGLMAREPMRDGDDMPDPPHAPASQEEPYYTSTIQPTFGLAPERQGGARATAGLVGAF